MRAQVKLVTPARMIDLEWRTVNAMAFTSTPAARPAIRGAGEVKILPAVFSRGVARAASQAGPATFFLREVFKILNTSRPSEPAHTQPPDRI
jgi:hypothetical protein